MKRKILVILITVTLLSIGLFQAVPALAASDDISVKISPSNFKIEETATLQFIAQAYDASGNELTDVTIAWYMEDNSAGNINEDTGLFKASSYTDKYSNAVEVVATDSDGNEASAYATVTVVDSDDVDDLDSVVVTPSMATVEFGDTVELLARGYDDNNVVLNDMTFDWEAEDADNAIDEDSTNDSCTFTAEDTNGTYTVTATEQDADGNDVSGTAEIKVTDDATTDQTGYQNRSDFGFGRGNSDAGFNSENSDISNNNFLSMLAALDSEFDFENFYGGELDINGFDTIELYPGVVESVTANDDTDIMVIEPNESGDEDTFVVDEDTIIRPNNTELKEGQEVIVITTDGDIDVAIMVVVVSSNSSIVPPGLNNNDNSNKMDNQNGNNNPSGWSNGNKTGWWDKIKNFFSRNQ